MITKISNTNFGKINARTFYQYLKNNLSDETFYISVGYIPDSEYFNYAGTLDSDSIFKGGLDSEYDVNDNIFYSQHTMSYHKIFPGSVYPVTKRVNWEKGVIYDSWPGTNSYVMVRDVESGFAKLNVYLCLFSPGTESVYPPTGTPAESFMLDNYVWKYLYTISNSNAVKFLDQNWMPVNPPITTSEIETLKPGSDRYNQLTVQNTAEAGLLFDLTITSQTDLNTELTSLGYSQGTVVNVTARDNSGNIPTVLAKFSLVYSSLYNKYITTLTQSGEGYVGTITFLDDNSGTELTNITGTVAPIGGFGSNPMNELNVTNIKISIRETNDRYQSAFVNNTPFNLMSLVLNPIDRSSKKIAKNDFYLGCKSLQTLNSNEFVVDDVITTITNDSNKIYRVIGVNNDMVYYINTQQNKEHFTLTDSDSIKTLNGSKTNVIRRVFDRDIFFGSGNILVSRYFGDTFYRTKDQIESFSFIINFE